MGLCSPGSISPDFRVSKPFWNAMGPTFLSLCNINLLTSEKIRSIDLLNGLKENPLDKWAQYLGECLSELPSGKSRRGHIETAISQDGIYKMSRRNGQLPRSQLSRGSRKLFYRRIYARFRQIPRGLHGQNKTTSL